MDLGLARCSNSMLGVWLWLGVWFTCVFHPSLEGIFFILTVLCHFSFGVCEGGIPHQYCQDFLFLLCDSEIGIGDPLLLLPWRSTGLILHREAERVVGVEACEEKKVTRRTMAEAKATGQIRLPTVILANVQLLRNKVDELLRTSSNWQSTDKHVSWPSQKPGLRSMIHSQN